MVDDNSEHKKVKSVNKNVAETDQKQWMLWISSLLLELNIKNSYTNNHSEKLFCQANCFNFRYTHDSFVVRHINFEKRKPHKNEFKFY